MGNTVSNNNTHGSQTSQPVTSSDIVKSNLTNKPIKIHKSQIDISNPLKFMADISDSNSNNSNRNLDSNKISIYKVSKSYNNSSNSTGNNNQDTYTFEFGSGKNTVEKIEKPRFSVGDKVSYHYNGVRSLATVTQIIMVANAPYSYTINFDGKDVIKSVPHDDMTLEKADFSRVERNWARMNRDAERRKKQQDQGYKCVCDPNFECICHLKVENMMPRVKLPKSKTDHQTLVKDFDNFIIKYKGGLVTPTFTFRGNYIADNEYKEGDVVTLNVHGNSHNYLATKCIDKNTSPLAGLPWVRTEGSVDVNNELIEVTVANINFATTKKINNNNYADDDSDDDYIIDEDSDDDYLVNPYSKGIDIPKSASLPKSNYPMWSAKDKYREWSSTDNYPVSSPKDEKMSQYGISMN